MNQSAPMPRTGFKFMLTVRDGPDAGATFQLLPPRVSIGRGADCNIMLNDPRVSRMAAMIEFTMEQITIQEISDRQALLVNGHFVTTASLKDRDVIRIGETEMTFIVEALALSTQGRPLSMMPPPGIYPPPRQSPDVPGVPYNGLSGKQKFYIAVAIMGGLFAWLMMSESTKAKKENGPRTNEQLEAESKQVGEKTDEVIKKREFKNEEEKTRFHEAQNHYKQGFRDFQKNQFARAMRSFETCRTIDPKNELCLRYYKLSEKSRDAMVDELIGEGRKYREKGMWSKCAAQFDKALDMMPNKENVKYKNADQQRKECDARQEGRF